MADETKKGETGDSLQKKSILNRLFSASGFSSGQLADASENLPAFRTKEVSDRPPSFRYPSGWKDKIREGTTV